MSIRIATDKCVGCKRCTFACPGNLIYLDKEGKAFIRFENDCWGCTACLKECDYDAIEYFLPKEIGGQGSNLKVKRSGKLLKWRITKADGNEVIIETSEEEGNKY